VIKTRYLSIFLFLPEPLYTCDPTGQVLLTGPHASDGKLASNQLTFDRHWLTGQESRLNDAAIRLLTEKMAGVDNRRMVVIAEPIVAHLIAQQFRGQMHILSPSGEKAVLLSAKEMEARGDKQWRNPWQTAYSKLEAISAVPRAELLDELETVLFPPPGFEVIRAAERRIDDILATPFLAPFCYRTAQEMDPERVLWRKRHN
jgi:hypothetical protein